MKTLIFIVAASGGIYWAVNYTHLTDLWKQKAPLPIAEQPAMTPPAPTPIKVDPKERHTSMDDLVNDKDAKGSGDNHTSMDNLVNDSSLNGPAK
jgi:hypothetical protein